MGRARAYRRPRGCRLAAAAAASLALGGGIAAGPAHAAAAAPRARPASAAVHTFAIPTGDSEPNAIAVGPDGALYFSEGNGYRIGRVTTAGQITQFDVPVGPYDTDADEGPAHLVSSGGSLWFVSDVGSTLYRMSTAGALTSFPWDGGDAIGLGPADTGGVWLFDRLATADDGRSIQVQRVDPSGAVSPYVTDDENQGFAPFALAHDGSAWYGEDLGSDQYLVRQTDAGAESKTAIAGSDPTDEVTSLAFSSSGTLWFTEHQEYDYSFPVGGEIGELSPSGLRLIVKEPVTDDLAPENLTAGTAGAMYFTWSGGIGAIAADGHVTLATLPGEHPTGLVDDGGELWFVDSGANVVGEVSATALFGATAAAPRPSLSAPRQTLRAVAAHRYLAASCTLRAAGRCSVSADVTPAQARRLRLHVARGAHVVRIARAAATLHRGGTARLRLGLARGTLRALGRARNVSVTLRATASSAGAPSRTATRRLTLRR